MISLIVEQDDVRPLRCDKVRVGHVEKPAPIHPPGDWKHVSIRLVLASGASLVEGSTHAQSVHEAEFLKVAGK